MTDHLESARLCVLTANEIVNLLAKHHELLLDLDAYEPCVVEMPDVDLATVFYVGDYAVWVAESLRDRGYLRAVSCVARGPAGKGLVVTLAPTVGLAALCHEVTT